MSKEPMTSVKTPGEIDAMRLSGGILAAVFAVLGKELAVGMTTKHLAEVAKKELKALGGQPSFLGYQGFPDVICISLNNEVVHGIPSARQIVADGDIVSLDLGVTVQGMITDGAISLISGTSPSKRVDNLLLATEKALAAGIDSVSAGVSVGDISAAVQEVLDKGNYGIVRDLVGHGVGHHIHEAPNIPNYGHKGRGLHLKAGMTIAIEPMATLGSHAVYVADDGWTVMTADGSLAAHFEHTILITPEGAEILTT